MDDTVALTQSEIDAIRAAFEKFDVDRSGSIDAWELKSTLEAMGQRPTDEEVFALLAECDEDGSGQIDFSEFLRVIAKQKQATSKNTVDQDIYEAFVSMGGNADKTGYVRYEKVKEVIDKFGLTIDLDRIWKDIDIDESGTVDYDEFSFLLTTYR
eukprot:TRINITY_DN4425_c0_g1_i1.p2 TRINITY_DN4425_c0_g1~~TRINITY_DN4425_c0_g1_i1.p2  ORF type:complete len:155 (-),score=49.22 TRINITY_DN4425_c0_g1_i1:1075-1539(-)